MKTLATLLLILLSLHLWAGIADPIDNTSGKPTISGYVKDASNGEMLIGATILVKEQGKGTATNNYGYYSLTLDAGTYTLVFSFVGYNAVEKTIKITQSTTVNIELTEETLELQEVGISAEKPNANVSKAEMSVTRLEMKNIQRIPALMGEVDVIKAIQMLPGVQTTAEGSSTFSVRGGAGDHNLILLDEATVYNASHLMGFFSVFNNDAIKDVKLYKGDIPASSGGRLASLLDVRMKDGNSKRFEGTGGIGTVSSRFTVEGPIIKDSTSFIASGRRTYIEVFKPFMKKEARDNQYYFYDLNLKVNHLINENNRLFLSGYFGRDLFANQGAKFGFGNKTLTLRWNHLFGKKLFLNTTAIYSNYDYYIGTNYSDDQSAFIWKSDITDFGLKLDFNYYLNQNNNIRFGVQSLYHVFNPGNARGLSEDAMLQRWVVPQNNTLEHGVYALNEQKLGSRITLKYGLRLSVFQNIGDATVYQYDANYVKIGEKTYGPWHLFNTYANLEPRLGAVFNLDDRNSIKASYSRTCQYIQQASNSLAGNPLDVWFPASPNIKPQMSDQYAVGYFRNFLNNTIETSAEVYYKSIENVIDFKDFANLFLNKELEGEIRTGQGKSYGFELFAKVNRERFGGWISYTYSRTFRTIDGVNKGREYRAAYDKPHNISIVLNYDISKRVVVSANWIYATGQAYTTPVGRFELDGVVLAKYSDRNSKRYPDYHRLDVALIVKPKKNFSRRIQGEWNISIYNVYAHKNAWAINFVQDKENPSVTYAEKTYLFTFVPSITYNLKF